MTDLSLFAHVLAKVLLLTGIGPAIFIYEVFLLAKAIRVPAHNQGEKVVSIEKPRNAAGMAGSGERGSIRLVG